MGWDLGDPSGAMNTVSGKSFHPLKGVKTTQFLIDIINRGRGNLHWRGDKEGFEDFAGAFTHLQGLSAPKPLDEMQEFEDFLAATWYVPNPFRVYKPNSQSSTSRLNPNRVRGTGTTFQSIPPAVNLFVAVNANCAHCHNAQTGRGELMGNGNVAGTGPGTHVDFTFNRNMSSDLRSSYRKNGFFYNTTECNSGFGLMSEGVMETWFNTSWPRYRWSAARLFRGLRTGAPLLVWRHRPSQLCGLLHIPPGEFCGAGCRAGRGPAPDLQWRFHRERHPVERDEGSGGHPFR
ncbi:MAG: hypothetical protein IPH53_09590 [Flavobacteriales bacterium]|nr:hypothetical protein [Flavobacteriales bacterium]